MSSFPSVFLLAACVGLAIALPCAAFDVPTARCVARLENGAVVSLTDAGGRVLAACETARGAGIRRIGGDVWADDTETLQAWDGATGRERYAGFREPAGTELTDAESCRTHIIAEYALDVESGDLVVRQHAQSSAKGVWGVEWSVAGIPLEMNVIVPGYSGLKLTRNTPGTEMSFDYPMSWEAQLAIVEGPGFGFYVWADDPSGAFKRLVVRREASGWRLAFITMPNAPFEDRDACDSAAWRLNTYEGDWRVPARRYRDWMERTFRPTTVAEQQPDWVKDTRCCVIMGQDIETLEALPSRLDPKQTLLYLPGWRKAGYDRDYPSYDASLENVAPFIDRAHELGFRVMLHVNYFGCDPLNPLYERFEPYQVRSPWGNHEKEWWLWTRATPEIKFAYINPAHKPWRDLIVARFSALCSSLRVDALHLDQTLCVYNDFNGPIDGQTMLEGNIALHRELREALPDVALSGEGLNEVTYRYEAFAQRHAWGLNHAEGTYNVRQLRAAHPISSYLLLPFTIIYGYLGYAPPTNGQLYAAWNEAYQYWGVIPTLKPNLAEVARPTGFSAQFFDEARCWMDRRVDPDVDADWPADVAFPFRAADGTRVVRTADRRLLFGNDEISRTLIGVSEIALPGSIAGWRACDAERLLGLDPRRWYPYLSAPRDMNAPHVAALPDGFAVNALVVTDNVAFVEIGPAGDAAILLADLLPEATCGSRPVHGTSVEVRGELEADDGATFSGAGEIIHAHPPYRTPGSGEAYARFHLRLPKDVARFVSEVGLETGADASDGVTFGVTVRTDDREERTSAHVALKDGCVPMALDLAALADRDAVVELTVGPGPASNPSFDWARWYGARIERHPWAEAPITLAGVPGWRLALAGTRAQTIPEGESVVSISANFPGAVYLLKADPAAVSLPVDLTAPPLPAAFIDETGAAHPAPQHACAQPGESKVGGMTRHGVFAHPPDHGRTTILYPMTLPESPAVFHAFVGIRDGAESEGVEFRAAVNGERLATERMLPGAWRALRCDLTPWAGKPVVLTLTTDACGEYNCDWAHWGEPEVRLP